MWAFELAQVFVLAKDLPKDGLFVALYKTTAFHLRYCEYALVIAVSWPNSHFGQSIDSALLLWGQAPPALYALARFQTCIARPSLVLVLEDSDCIFRCSFTLVDNDNHSAFSVTQKATIGSVRRSCYTL
jgi:hypothetical protein